MRFPRGAFLSVEGATSDSVVYTEMETITWVPQDLTKPTKFSVIPPQYQGLKSILGPFLGITNMSTLLSAIIAALVAAGGIGLATGWLVRFPKRALDARKERRAAKSDSGKPGLWVVERGACVKNKSNASEARSHARGARVAFQTWRIVRDGGAQDLLAIRCPGRNDLPRPISISHARMLQAHGRGLAT
jgi:hypothetical protein